MTILFYILVIWTIAKVAADIYKVGNITEGVKIDTELYKLGKIGCIVYFSLVLIYLYVSTHS